VWLPSAAQAQREGESLGGLSLAAARTRRGRSDGAGDLFSSGVWGSTVLLYKYGAAHLLVLSVVLCRCKATPLRVS